MTVPRFRKNPQIKPFRLLCPGISQNSKNHHLTLYRGQVWEEKSYFELCKQNVLNIIYTANSTGDLETIVKNGKLFVPPVPGLGFIRHKTQIPWENEILQSFAELTNITYICFQCFDKQNHIIVNGRKCSNIKFNTFEYQCAPPNRYSPLYMWTKEAFKIQMKVVEVTIN